MMSINVTLILSSMHIKMFVLFQHIIYLKQGWKNVSKFLRCQGMHFSLQESLLNAGIFSYIFVYFPIYLYFSIEKNKSKEIPNRFKNNRKLHLYMQEPNSSNCRKMNLQHYRKSCWNLRFFPIPHLKNNLILIMDCFSQK